VRVLLLAPHPFFQTRGTPIAERSMLQVLAAAGHELVVLTYPEGEDPGISGCRVERLRGRWLPRGVHPGLSWKKLVCDAAMTLRCLALVRRERFDLVHAVEESAFMALAARRLRGVPYVYDMDSCLAEQAMGQWLLLRALAPLLRWCERAAVRGSAGVLALCPAVEEHARRQWPQGLVRLLSDPSMLETTGEVAGAEEGAAPLVMYVGNLEPYQGIDLLLAGFAVARRSVPDARLLIADPGDPARRRPYVATARRLGIEAAVEWHGPQPVERLGELLSRATVLVSPRLTGINTPMKIYSFLDSGRPLLATRMPAHVQVLDDEIACLVEPNPADFGAGLVRLLRDPALRRRLAVRALERAAREFTREIFSDRLRAFYGEVEERLNGGGPRARHRREAG
jgi:glycosyltransferase involved in cell wall biosynthesis